MKLINIQARYKSKKKLYQQTRGNNKTEEQTYQQR